MKISHVIRGEDHIPNTPKQIILQKSLGFNQPQYAHLPLILSSDKKKMSKRHGATSVLEYKLDGYLPEALVNFMAFLGWNPGTEQEIYSIKKLLKDFNIKKIQKSGAVFDTQKLDSINSYYIRQKPIEELTNLCLPFLVKDKIVDENIDKEKLEKIISLYQKRLKKLSEISDLISFFFKDFQYSKELLKWKEMTEEETKASLNKSKDILLKIEDKDFNKNNLTEILLKKAKMFGKDGDRGCLLWPLRVSLTGKENSASPFEIADILGKEETINRINKALNI